MDKRGTVLETVTALPAQLARNQHAARAAEDLAHKLALRLRRVEAIAPSEGVDLQAAATVAAAATALDVVK